MRQSEARVGEVTKGSREGLSERKWCCTCNASRFTEGIVHSAETIVVGSLGYTGEVTTPALSNACLREVTMNVGSRRHRFTSQLYTAILFCTENNSKSQLKNE